MATGNAVSPTSTATLDAPWNRPLGARGTGSGLKSQPGSALRPRGATLESQHGPPSSPLRTPLAPSHFHNHNPPQYRTLATAPPPERVPPMSTQDELKFGIAGSTPLPHLPLREQSSRNLRLGKSKSEKRTANPRTTARAEEPFPQELAHKIRPRSAQLSPTLSPSQASFNDTSGSNTSSLLGPPEIFSPPRRPSTARQNTPSTASSLSLASTSSIRPSPSIPDYNTFKNSFRTVSTPYPAPDRPEQDTRASAPASRRNGLRGEMANGPVRESLRSAMTTGSSAVDLSGTERSSIGTVRSSTSESPHLKHGWSNVKEDSDDEGVSVDDYISMYVDGFADDPASPPPVPSIRHPSLKPSTATPTIQEHLETAHNPTLESETQSKHLAPRLHPQATLAPRLPLGPVPRPFAAGPRTSAQIMAGLFDADVLPSAELAPSAGPHRDRYGFKKDTQYVKEAQYDTWNASYSKYLDRRRVKWNELMTQHNLSIEDPEKFPPKSDKVKRYIRKGVPPEWRGAAWFWYGGGPARVSQKPRLYRELAERAERGDMSEQDREHIERDLNRTFPDNVQFKTEAAFVPNPRVSQMTTGSLPVTVAEETPMIKSLRRVLRAFAIHHPKVGYCQSLNFLAGQLLLFLRGDEEKAFHLLCILTDEHLPGTHGIALEGANIDIGVLMQSLKDIMPATWVKLDDRSSQGRPMGDMRSQTGLPTVSLATTAWFMSCFVGTLPVESACRVWDCLFYEGAKTLFRVALGIFRLGEPEIKKLNDHMEVFQVVQTLPRRLLDANALMEASFGRSLEGRGLLSQGTVDKRRTERRGLYNTDQSGALQPPPVPVDDDDEDKRPLSRGRGTIRRLKSIRKSKA